MYDFRIRGNSKFRVNTIISATYIKCSCVSLLEPWQNNLSNPEAYSEPCQTSKIGCSVCYYDVMYVFQCESTLHSCLNVKELLARSRREI